MADTIFEMTNEELAGFGFFDLGLVTKVIRRPLSEVDDEERDYHFEAQDNIVNLYNVDLTTRNQTFHEIPLMIRKNEISALNEGDQVLVGYLGPNRFPFIWQSVTWDMFSARKKERISSPIAEDEEYITGGKSNLIHWRKDGAIVMRGADAVEGDSVSNCYFILGGEQGNNVITGKKIMFSIGVDQTGPVLQCDQDGNVLLDANRTLMMAPFDMKQMIDSLLEVFVGVEVEENETRQGVGRMTFCKHLETTVGETHILNVGDVTKPQDDNRHTATSTVNVAKKYTMNLGAEASVNIEMVAEDGKTDTKFESVGCEVHIDDVAQRITIDRGSWGKLYITPNGGTFGDLHATQWMVLGIKLVQWLSTHTHISTSPGQPTSQPVQAATLNTVLSTHYAIKDG